MNREEFDKKVEDELAEVQKTHANACAIFVHPKIKVGEERDYSNSLVGYFKQPDRVTYGQSLQLFETNKLEAKILVALKCFVAGDERIIKEDNHLISVSMQIGEMIEVEESELKKN